MVRLLSYLKRHQRSIQIWTLSLLQLAQVIAFVLAGIWTYSTFYLSEKPSLEPRGETTAALQWDAFANSKDTCVAVLTVSFGNHGKRSIDVRSVTIDGYLSDRPSSVAQPRPIVRDDLKHGTWVVKSYPGSRLNGHYPPGEVRYEGFVWYFPRQPDKYAYFKVTLETEPHQEQTASVWQDVCSEKAGAKF